MTFGAFEGGVLVLFNGENAYQKPNYFNLTYDEFILKIKLPIRWSKREGIAKKVTEYFTGVVSGNIYVTKF